MSLFATSLSRRTPASALLESFASARAAPCSLRKVKPGHLMKPVLKDVFKNAFSSTPSCLKHPPAPPSSFNPELERATTMARTRQHAQDHVSGIRRSRGLDVDGQDSMNVEDLHAALEMLSEQLYQKHTRFIMELIQNADDNSYGDRTPELSLTLVGRNLHIACNETGFTQGDVDAICRINRSTKKNANAADGYVGEKGIGFKSVFKVADVVWISSGHYSFQFDKRSVLGMITPAWADFPVKPRYGHTEFYLQFPPDADVDDIKKELLALQPSLLLFLRRLRRINIQVPDHPPIKLACEMTPTGRKLSRDGVENEYLVHEHTVTGMPKEERRAGITKTSVVVAFPLDNQHKAIIAAQDVFAFLPIRSYGFKFLIQADFLLVASREDIDQSRPWNKDLLTGLVDAFMQVLSPPMHPVLKYQWPLYLPRDIDPSIFIKSLETRILRRIRHSNVIVSHTGTLERPANLRRIPSGHLYDEATTMFSYNRAPYKPLSFRYSLQCFENLRSVGVDTETFADFLSRLKTFVGSDPAGFQQMHEKWHERLAQIICKEISGSMPQSLMELPIIPLANGAWVSSSDNTIFFDTDQPDMKIPGGLGVCKVHQQACQNHWRRSLFSKLGVQDCNHTQICHTIIKKHREMSPQRGPLSTDEITAVVEQARFLFATNYGSLESDNVWFATAAGTLVRGPYAYMDDPAVCKLEEYLDRSSNPIEFIHEDYTAGMDERTKTSFFKWLRNNFEVSPLPRLGTHQENGSDMAMTTEFKQMVQSRPSRKVLTLIRDHWHSYSSVIPFEGSSPLLHDLRWMSVLCQDGQLRPLCHTYLPLRALKSKAPILQAVPFVDIPDHDDESWQHLGRLGFRTTDDLAFYLDCLISLRRNWAHAASVESLDETYAAIQDLSREDPSLVKSKFREEALIYLPPTNSSPQGSWCKPEDCVWAAPASYINARPLRPHYQCYESLFRYTLEIRNAGLQDVARELMLLEGKEWSPEDVLQLLDQANQCIRNGQDKAHLNRLQSNALFPISSVTNGLGATFKSALDPSWLIADFSSLKTSFSGRLDLLSFSPEQCRKLHPLLEALKLEHKLLSHAVEQDVQSEGNAVTSDRLRDMLMPKTPYLLRLAASANRKQAEAQLMGAEFYEVSAVVVHRFVRIRESPGAAEREVHGMPGAGGAVVKTIKTLEGQDSLQVFVATGSLAPEIFPPYELSTELCRLCRIDDAHIRLVDHVLRLNDTARIEELLDGEGIRLLKDVGNRVVEESDDEGKDDELSPMPSLGDHDSSLGDPARSERDKSLAFAGEKFVFDVLRERIGDLDHSVWTSHLRERDGHSPFTEDEAEYADFTIRDTSKSLAFLLSEKEQRCISESATVTYHIEVKSTPDSRTSPFFMSYRQLKKARQCTFAPDGCRAPKDIYVIARVFRATSGQLDCYFYVDPWRLYLRGDLELKSPQGSYIVRANI